MQLQLCAVGQRMPGWVDEACSDYLKRMPVSCSMVLREVKAEPRTLGKSPADMMAAEAQRLDAAMLKGARRVVLDERGTRWTTAQLAQRMTFWLGDGRDVSFFIGGPDGLDAAFAARADETFRLSDLTLPHAMVRVMLTEALYRAWSLTQGHPYHRE
jgi:23S rRNA (pseudouridine1915-N3)-methyltransferase